jgi:propanol-preferring alcohol dehydrogenase
MLSLVAENKIQVETNVFHGLNDVPRMVDLSHSSKMKCKAICVVDEKAIGEEKGKATS